MILSLTLIKWIMVGVILGQLPVYMTELYRRHWVVPAVLAAIWGVLLGGILYIHYQVNTVPWTSDNVLLIVVAAAGIDLNFVAMLRQYKKPEAV